MLRARRSLLFISGAYCCSIATTATAPSPAPLAPTRHQYHTPEYTLANTQPAMNPAAATMTRPLAEPEQGRDLERSYALI